MVSADQLYERGHVAVLAGRHAEGARLLTRALERSDDRELRTRILITQAYQAAERGSTADGLAILGSVEDRGLSRKLQGLLSGQRGLLLMRSGDGDRALGALDHAVARLHDEPADRTRALLNRGNVHLQRRDLARAAVDFASCAEVARDHELAWMHALATHNLGYVELLAGRLPEALRAMDDARSTLRAHSDVDQAVTSADRAQVLVAAGLAHEADTTLSEVAESFGRMRLRQSQAEAELSRAELHASAGRPAEAARLARRAGTRFRRRGSTSWALRADALALAAQVDSGRGFAAAMRDGPRLADALAADGLHDQARTVRLHIARAALGRSEAGEAARVLGTVQKPPTSPMATRLLDRSVRADLAVARGRRTDATRHLRRGLADLFAWQSSFGSLDLQTGVASHGRALAVRGLRLAVEDGRPAVVFDWAERARAFASRLPPVRPPADADGAAALEELRQLRAESGPTPALPTRRRMGELERLVRDHALYSPGPGIVTEPPSLAELQSVLAERGGTLVTHLVIDGTLHALVATTTDASAHALGPYDPLDATIERVGGDLDTAATVLPSPIRDAVGTSLRTGLDALDAALWRPLARAARTDGPVLLVPSALLAGVPWTLLPGLAGRPLSVARTATSWAHNRRPDEPVRAVGLVAGPAVHRAEEEVQRSAMPWEDATELSGPDATAAAVTGLAARVDLLHVAAHGTHSPDNPLFSALELADGPWFGHDIAAVDPVPAHVVLSACELGRSSVRSGEETLGMTAAWQHAGARTVLASPVRVNDVAACEVLAGHHARLAAGAAPAAALAEALAALPADAAPAPLVCFGAGW